MINAYNFFLRISIFFPAKLPGILRCHPDRIEVQSPAGELKVIIDLPAAAEAGNAGLSFL
ncbi:MAG: hypothetical protein CVU71_05100 [Deltaproteobacteria bacterium HGW-Deltaproteobacteria-6]|nr:MAG: hypothetical protein CVU71_05100 [Deltaproteobacteria bacterium HGW-Deltaproteobacteria-6]